MSFGTLSLVVVGEYAIRLIARGLTWRLKLVEVIHACLKAMGPYKSDQSTKNPLSNLSGIHLVSSAL